MVGAGIGGAAGAGAGGATDDSVVANQQTVTSAPVMDRQTVTTAPATGVATTCRNCGAPLRPGAVFCARCGTPVVEETTTHCPRCGGETQPGDMFCPHCGNRLTPAAASAPGTTPGGYAAAPVVAAAAPSMAPMEVAPAMTPTEAAPAPAMAPAASEVIAPVAAPAPMVESQPAPAPMAPAAMAAPALAGTAPFPGERPAEAAPGQPRLEVLGSGQVVPLPDKDEVLIGREDPLSEPPIFPDVDLTPFGGEEGGVSRRHARIVRRGSDYLLEDLQSTNYTKLNGQRIAARTPTALVDGSRVDFGRVAMVFRR